MWPNLNEADVLTRHAQYSRRASRWHEVRTGPFHAVHGAPDRRRTGGRRDKSRRAGCVRRRRVGATAGAGLAGGAGPRGRGHGAAAGKADAFSSSVRRPCADWGGAEEPYFSAPGGLRADRWRGGCGVRRLVGHTAAGSRRLNWPRRPCLAFAVAAAITDPVACGRGRAQPPAASRRGGCCALHGEHGRARATTRGAAAALVGRMGGEVGGTMPRDGSLSLQPRLPIDHGGAAPGRRRRDPRLSDCGGRPSSRALLRAVAPARGDRVGRPRAALRRGRAVLSGR